MANGIVSLLKFDAEASESKRREFRISNKESQAGPWRDSLLVLPLLLETRFVGQVYRVPERPL